MCTAVVAREEWPRSCSMADPAAPRATRGDDLEQAATHVDDGATVGALARVPADAWDTVGAELHECRHDDARPAAMEAGRPRIPRNSRGRGPLGVGWRA